MGGAGGAATAASGGGGGIARGRSSGSSLSCTPSEAFFPALVRLPLRQCEAGAKLRYDRTLRTQVRTETPLRFVEWQGKLVFDLASPSVFVDYCEGAATLPFLQAGPAHALLSSEQQQNQLQCGSMHVIKDRELRAHVAFSNGEEGPEGAAVQGGCGGKGGKGGGSEPSSEGEAEASGAAATGMHEKTGGGSGGHALSMKVRFAAALERALPS